MIRLTAGAACFWIMASAGVGAATKHGTMGSSTPAAHLRVDDRLGDILNHPAFTGFGRLVLPWDEMGTAAEG